MVRQRFRVTEGQSSPPRSTQTSSAYSSRSPRCISASRQRITIAGFDSLYDVLISVPQTNCFALLNCNIINCLELMHASFM